MAEHIPEDFAKHDIDRIQKELTQRHEDSRRLPFRAPSTVWRGHRVRAVYDQLFYRPVQEPLTQFQLYLCTESLGRTWLRSEEAKSIDCRHVVIDWYSEMRRLRDSAAGAGTSNERTISSFQLTAKAQCLSTLAEDIYRLKIVGRLDEQLLGRLRNRREFQGARYELAVAAMFVRGNFDIDWLKYGGKRPEFVARSRATNESLAVEAKSRRRQGVLHEGGLRKPEHQVRADVSGHINEALKQAPGFLPFAIFVDLNMPPSAINGAYDTWSEIVDTALGEAAIGTAAEPFRASLIVLSNYSWHYLATEPAITSPSMLSVPDHCVKPFYDKRTLEEIVRAVALYGTVPDDDAIEDRGSERAGGTV